MHARLPMIKRAFITLSLLTLFGIASVSYSRTPPRTENQIGTYLSHLPVAPRKFPFHTVFGVQTNQLTISGGLEKISQANATWVRRNGILWKDVAPIQGPLDWSNVASLDQELVDAAAAGLEVILVIRGTPEWAQANPPNSCGPIRLDKMPAFASFLTQLVARYSPSPYQVQYYEIWNEPDVDPDLAHGPDSIFGCWGDHTDPYYGGEDFGDMLTVAYPAIKAGNPYAQLLVGGLLLDCDPRLPGACTNPHGTTPSRFLEGILRRSGSNDGGNYFDGISFHAYDFYTGQLGQYDNPNWGTTWNTTGPSMGAKLDFLQETLADFNVTDKYFMNTESALLCESCLNDPTFEATKANYLVINFATALNLGLEANIWYTMFGWRNSGLIDSNLNPKPAYYAFQFIRQILADATPIGQINAGDVVNGSQLQGFKFQREDRFVWVLWSQDGSDHQITFIPGIPDTVYDVDGDPLTPTQTMTVGVEPRFVEWIP